MDYVTTVIGDIPASDIGHCQPHEHVYITGTPALSTRKELRINRLGDSILELIDYKNSGGDTVVDAQPIAAGRDALALKEAQQESGVNIIASTGYHLPFFYTGYNHWIYNTSQEELSEFFIEEITNGMYLGGNYLKPQYRTDIRAGIIKAVLTEDGFTGVHKKLLIAAGKAAAFTGTALLLHTELGIGALNAIDMLSSMGLPPERILVCHVDRSTQNRSTHYELGKAGVYLEYDTITLFKFHDNESEIELIQDMISKGYLDQLLISTDPTADRLKHYEGTVGIDYILNVFIPKLKKAGFSAFEIDTLVHVNPSKALKRTRSK